MLGSSISPITGGDLSVLSAADSLSPRAPWPTTQVMLSVIKVSLLLILFVAKPWREVKYLHYFCVQVPLTYVLTSAPRLT